MDAGAANGNGNGQAAKAAQVAREMFHDPIHHQVLRLLGDRQNDEVAAALEKLLGVPFSVSRISRWRHGHDLPSSGLLFALIAVSPSVSVEELLFGRTSDATRRQAQDMLTELTELLQRARSDASQEWGLKVQGGLDVRDLSLRGRGRVRLGPLAPAGEEDQQDPPPAPPDS